MGFRFAEVVARHGGEERAAWLRTACEGLTDAMKVRVALARCARKLGAEAVSLSGQERATLPAGPAYERWVLQDFGRAAIVLAALSGRSDDDQVALLEPLIRRGEIGEQVSLLRMAPILPLRERLVDVMVDACRTNSLDVFEAIACENPFVRDHFPELNYNQVVLKAMFMGVSVSRISGLAERVSDELVRMATDFGDERRAAGRVVPEDIAKIQALAEAKKQ